MNTLEVTRNISTKQTSSSPGFLKPIGDFNLETITLRESNLTLSKFDECMPNKSQESKSAIYNKAKLYPSFSRQMKKKSNRTIPDNEEQLRTDGEDTPGKLPVMLRRPNNQVAAESSIPKELIQHRPSLLQEMVNRQRHLFYIIMVIFGFMFASGCIITTVCFSSASTELIPGKVIGLVMMIGGATCCILVGKVMSRPDVELKKKIENREKMFATFKEIVAENQERRNSMLLTERVIPKINSVKDNKPA